MTAVPAGLADWRLALNRRHRAEYTFDATEAPAFRRCSRAWVS
jgi:hypothetical protein